MVQEVWLHIGTPKSGTSSLQKHLVAHRTALARQGLAYLTPPGKTSSNDLAIAINRDRPELAGLAAGLNREIEDRPEARALISSEMFYGIDPDRLRGLLPALGDRPLKVLVYLRRQDRYIEAMFLQKSKNGRFLGSIADYIAKFDGSGSGFAEMLRPWETAGGDVTLVPRVLEPDKLTGGDVVADARAQIGLPAMAGTAEADVNVSPGLHRVQLLQAAAMAGLGNPRRLQRVLSAKYPQDPAERAPILDRRARRAYLDRYRAGNAALRARYFPEMAELFDEGDLEGDAPDTGIAPFTEAQLREILRLLQTIRDLG